jgi:hypothetical protein
MLYFSKWNLPINELIIWQTCAEAAPVYYGMYTMVLSPENIKFNNPDLIILSRQGGKFFCLYILFLLCFVNATLYYSTILQKQCTTLNLC